MLIKIRSVIVNCMVVLNSQNTKNEDGTEIILMLRRHEIIDSVLRSQNGAK